MSQGIFQTEERSGSPLSRRRRSSEDVLVVGGAGIHGSLSPIPRSGNVTPVSDWLGRIDSVSPVPERPSSTATVRHGFDDLFPEVVPPKRPLTPSPEQRDHHKAMDSVPVRPTARRTSEAVAIERIFQNFSLGSGDLLPTAEEPQQPSSPLPAATAIVDNDQLFKTDLANVLVWFENDLTNSQRITTAFTLLNHLTTWQLRFVLSLLSKPSEDHTAEAHFIESFSSSANQVPYDNSPPPGFVQVETPTIYHQPPQQYQAQRVEQHSPTRSNQGYGLLASPTMSNSSSTSTNSDLTLEQCNPELFHRDIPAWLRSLRLHKYATCFQSMKQDEILGLADAQGADERLERMGISALGARRKILRVLATINSGR